MDDNDSEHCAVFDKKVCNLQSALSSIHLFNEPHGRSGLEDTEARHSTEEACELLT